MRAFVLGGLNRDIAEKNAKKLDPALEKRLRLWLLSLFEGPDVPGCDNALYRIQIEDAKLTFQALLKNGEILCHVLNKLAPGTIKKINVGATRAFLQIENIDNYLKTVPSFGVAPVDLFITVDLYEGKDIPQVMNNLNRLCELHKKKLSTKGERTDEALKPIRTLSLIKTSNTKVPSPLAGMAFAPGGGSANSTGSSHAPRSPMTAGPPTLAPPSVTSLDDDVMTKEQFKYDPVLERIAKQWIEAILQEPFPAGLSFATALKSGVTLCRLINTIKPGLVLKINEKPIAYNQMENIQSYLIACQKLGLRDTDLFNTPDLFDQKNMSLVVSNIHVLAKHVQKLGYNVPPIEDSSSARTLFSASLVVGSGGKIFDDVNEQELSYDDLPPDQRELVDWINKQLDQKNSSGNGMAWIFEMKNAQTTKEVTSVKNLRSDLRNGVHLMDVLENVCKSAHFGMIFRKPKSLSECMHNATMVIRFLSAQTFEPVSGCTAYDIVMGNVAEIMTLIKYIRDKFDLEFLYHNLMNSDALSDGVLSQEETEELHDEDDELVEDEGDDEDDVNDDDGDDDDDEQNGDDDDGNEGEGEGEGNDDATRFFSGSEHNRAGPSTSINEDAPTHETVEYPPTTSASPPKDKAYMAHLSPEERRKIVMQQREQRQLEEQNLQKHQSAATSTVPTATTHQIEASPSTESSQTASDAHVASAVPTTDAGNMDNNLVIASADSMVVSDSGAVAISKLVEKEKKHVFDAPLQVTTKAHEKDHVPLERQLSFAKDLTTTSTTHQSPNTPATIQYSPRWQAPSAYTSRLAELIENAPISISKQIELQEKQASFEALAPTGDMTDDEASPEDEHVAGPSSRLADTQPRSASAPSSSEEMHPPEPAMESASAPTLPAPYDTSPGVPTPKTVQGQVFEPSKPQKPQMGIEPEPVSTKQEEAEQLPAHKSPLIAPHPIALHTKHTEEPTEVPSQLEKTAESTEQVTEPAEETAAPVEQVKEPVEEIMKSMEQVTESAKEIRESVEQATAPALETMESVEQIKEPAEENTEPVGEVAKHVEKAEEPAEIVTEPAEETTEPVGEVTIHVEKAEESVEETTEPMEEITNQAEEATGPVEKITEPAVKPVSNEYPVKEAEQTPVSESAPQPKLEPEPVSPQALEPSSKPTKREENTTESVTDVLSMHAEPEEQIEQPESANTVMPSAEPESEDQEPTETNDTTNESSVAILAKEELERTSLPVDPDATSKSTTDTTSEPTAALATTPPSIVAPKKDELVESMNTNDHVTTVRIKAQSVFVDRPRASGTLQTLSPTSISGEVSSDSTIAKDRLNKASTLTGTLNMSDLRMQYGSESDASTEGVIKLEKRPRPARSPARIVQDESSRTSVDQEAQESAKASASFVTPDTPTNKKKSTVQKASSSVTKADKPPSKKPVKSGLKKTGVKKPVIVRTDLPDASATEATAAVTVEDTAAALVTPNNDDARSFDHKKMKAQALVRKRVVDELLQTEQNYAMSLQVLVKNFIRPLEAAGTLTNEEIFLLVANIEDLLELHSQLLEVMKTRVSKWTDNSVVSDIFIKNAHFFLEYKPFMINYGASLLYLTYFSKKYPSVRRIIENFDEAQKQTTRLTVEALLIMPIQRLPRYILLLKEMKKYTNLRSVDEIELQKAIVTLEKVIQELNQNLNRDAMEALRQLQSIIKSLEGETHTYLDPSSQFLLEAALHCKRIGDTKKTLQMRSSISVGKTYQEFTCFLFTHMLLLCRPIEDGDRQLDGRMPHRVVDVLFVRDMTKAFPKLNSSSHASIELHFNYEPLVQLKCRTPEEAKQWLLALQTVISATFPR